MHRYYSIQTQIFTEAVPQISKTLRAALLTVPGLAYALGRPVDSFPHRLDTASDENTTHRLAGEKGLPRKLHNTAKRRMPGGGTSCREQKKSFSKRAHMPANREEAKKQDKRTRDEGKDTRPNTQNP